VLLDWYHTNKKKSQNAPKCIKSNKYLHNLHNTKDNTKCLNAKNNSKYNKY
jgi:hypothetical protein